jgi:hypothetical protein
VRKHILEAMDEEPDDTASTVPMRPGLRPLERGERPPYDLEAT